MDKNQIALNEVGNDGNYADSAYAKTIPIE